MIISSSINFTPIVTALSNTDAQTQTSNSAFKIVRERDLNISITLKSETRISREVSFNSLSDRSLTILFKKTVYIEKSANLFREIDSTISIVEVCYLFFRKSINNNKELFVVLFLVKKDRFYTRRVYLYNKITIVATLDLILFSYYLSAEKDSEFKLINSKTVVEQVAINQLKFILITS